jgi:hypothetical protein
VSSRWPAQGVLATCTGKAGRGGLGGMLAGLGRGDGALWAHVGELMPVGTVQRGRGRREGVRAVSSLSFHVSRPGSGQRGLGLDRGEVSSMATGLGRTGTSMATVALILPGFRSPSVRHNARKNSKFKFLKSFTLGCQHITQGFQRYFC